MLATRAIGRVRRWYYSLINRLAPHRKVRWAITCILVIAYIQTVQLSVDIATYLIGFYLLQLLIGYFTPKGVRNEDTGDEAEGEGLYEYSFGEQVDQQLPAGVQEVQL